ncbi:hypothetical protein [Endozoicomonas euniceicola]|uniref:Uncharacterized protein n=1 Tax=Endozoicomonas euniceicola TaxID=1234143 RepID=A0ABY6GY61_9GAMM|nr:hypothetical protein [Endozoicomonas euniceicola]UYM17712.1 hypothetical protein NX720_07335 [Endozoicomonas euniceicola]
MLLISMVAAGVIGGALLVKYAPDYDAFEESMSVLPKITYEVDSGNSDKHAGSEVVLKPKIIRGEYIYPRKSDRAVLMKFVGRAICEPARDTPNTSVDLNELYQKCHEWFKDHTMKFPHQALRVKVDQLDTLLLPKLIYNVNTKKLELHATPVSYVKSDGSPSTANSAVTRTAKSWQRLSPSFPGLNNLSREEKKALHICHHAPELSKMQHPLESADNQYYYDFPVPGLSHLHETGHEFFIVTLHSKLGHYGYYWVIDQPWPHSYQTVKFSKTKYIDPFQPL